MSRYVSRVADGLHRADGKQLCIHLPPDTQVLGSYIGSSLDHLESNFDLIVSNGLCRPATRDDMDVRMDL